MLTRKLKRKIKKEGSEEERHLLKSGRSILRLVDKLETGKKYEEKWSSFYLLKSAFEDNVQRYKGKYSNYFSRVLDEINEQERQALGYHLH